VVGTVQSATTITVKYSLDPAKWKGSFDVLWFQDSAYFNTWSCGNCGFPTNVNTASGTLTVPVPNSAGFPFYVGIAVSRGKNEFGSPLGSDTIRIPPFYKSGTTLIGGTLISGQPPPPPIPAAPASTFPPTVAGAKWFIRGSKSTNVCPTGSVKITDADGCRSAASAYGIGYNGASNEPAWPTGCYQYFDSAGWSAAYFSNTAVGGPQGSAQPLCIST